LPTPVGPRNRNEPFGRRGSERPARSAPDGVGHDAHGLVLTDDALRERLLHAQELLLLALEHLGDGNAGPLGDDFRDLLLGDLVAHQARLLAFRFLRLRETLLELGDTAVLQLRHAAEIARATRGFELETRTLEFLLDLRGALKGGLLGLPHFFEIGVFLLEELSVSSSAASLFFEASSSSFFSASCSILSWMMRRSRRSSASGLESISMRMRAAASSIRSIALSGSWRLVM
jgi:Protein of unknown function (DUF3170).